MPLHTATTATRDDMPAIIALLKSSGLPYQDITPAHLDDFLLAVDGGKLVGVVGLERYGCDALLRSLGVHPDRRGAGLGAQLVATIEAHAGRTGISHLYLLTTTAADFFARRGYAGCERTDVPSSIQQSAEFSGLCPAQAACMHKTLTGVRQP
jgi:amino-acid N-acetyltransferase